MTEVERLQQLKDVEADVEVGEFGVECLEFGVLRISRDLGVTSEMIESSR